MPDTLPNITIPKNTWVNLYAESGIDVGKQLTINNVGASDVFIVVSATMPTDETAYTVALKPRDLPFINNVGDSGLWAFSGNCKGLVNVSEYRLKTTPPKRSAFGEASVAENSPVLQITAQYGLLREVLVAAIGGTATAQDSKFTVSTGTGINNVAAIVSRREAQYKAGQGLSCRITAVFTEGKANSTQQAGLITSESAFAFGFNGTEFGILHARDGELENQELTITTGATVDENASITIDGVNLSVPITNSTAEQNAYEIATYLSANRPGYGFTSNGNKVIALAQLPDFGAGLWDFTSGTAVAVWDEIKNGLIPTETWVRKEDWNVRPDINIDPTLGNVYQIQIQYLGFGGIKFYVEEPITGELVLVHIIQYANTSTRPSVSNPIFRVGWAARNTGNNTDIIVQGASGTAYVEGKINYDAIPNGANHNQSGISTTRTNVIAFRNRLTFNEKANRAEIIPQLLSLASDTNKIAVFEIIEDPVVGVGEFLEFEYLDEVNSLMEASKTPSSIVGGKVIASFNVTLGGIPPIDMQKVLKFQSPNSTYSIAAFVVGTGTGAVMSASGTWQEDL